MYTLNSKPHWMTFDFVLKISNNITAAVYAFAYCEKKPEDTIWPFAEKELFYVGISGGLNDEFSYDTKGNRKGRFETRFHKRMKDHRSNLIGNGNKQETSYEVFHQHFKGLNVVGKKIFVCVIIPDKNIEKEIMRTSLLLMEAEQKKLHYDTFGKLPMMNIAEKSNFSDKSKNINSISQQKITNLKENNIMEFFK
jgi:hypothetical protein